jgi:glutamyl-tRNA synthetase
LAGRKPKYDGTCRERKDQLEAPYVVRFKLPDPDGEVTFVDRIKGPITFRNEELDDLILQRTDGTPTYNFVVVIDDAEMGITLVIRGDDHINNTPRQIHLYRALGYAVPEFAHVPMILGDDKKRLSKRHGATSVMAYKEQGFLPEAMINYLVRLGWSHGDQEIFSMDELIEKFTIEAVGRSAGVFNPEKLLWLNSHYIKAADPAALAELLRPFLVQQGIDPSAGPDLTAVVKGLQERSATLVQMAEGAAFYFAEQPEFDEKTAAKFLVEEQRPLLTELKAALAACGSFAAGDLEMALTAVGEKLGLKFGKVAQPLRSALTGGAPSPGIYEVLQVLGRERVVKRIEHALGLLK